MERRIHLRNKAEAAPPSGPLAAPGTSAGTLSDKKIRCDAAGASDGQEPEDRQAKIAKHFIGQDPKTSEQLTVFDPVKNTSFAT